MEGVGYIKLIEPITGPRALFKSDLNSLGDLNFGQPYLVHGVWYVRIWGFDVEGTPILDQAIEIDIPTGEVPANGRFFWGSVMIYIAKVVKKKLCPKCT
jgi:hypothetical protein